MPLIGFTVFKEKVKDGTKRQTIRKLRKCPIRKGDRLYLYWHTRRKDCEKLGEAICTEVFEIVICSNRKIHLDDPFPHYLTFDDKDDLAKRDGFGSIKEFFDFFEQHHSLPARFQVIRW